MSDYKFISTTNMLVVKDGKGLFIKRDDDLEDFPGWLMLPGGKQKAGETPSQSSIRETFEETGLKVSAPTLKVIATHDHLYKDKVYIVFIFQADKFSGKLIDYEEGKGKPIWLDLRKTLTDPKLYPDLKRHIRLAMDSNDNEVLFTYHKFNKDLEIIDEK